MKHKKRLLTGIVLMILSLIPNGYYIYKDLDFEQNLKGYLKQAADAGSVYVAEERLSKAINYLDSHNMTSGYTSIFYKTEDDNVGYFYHNLIVCHVEIMRVMEASHFEQTNELMRLRETLMDGEEITIPPSLYLHPNNKLFFLLNTFCVIMFFIGIFCIGSALKV